MISSLLIQEQNKWSSITEVRSFATNTDAGFNCWIWFKILFSVCQGFWNVQVINCVNYTCKY